MDTSSLAPAKKTPIAPQLGDKYNIKPPVLKRLSSDPPDAPPLRKKYRPLNTPCNSAKEIKVKIIPAQIGSFQDAKDSAPVPNIWRKKKKASANQESPSDRIRFERPGTPFPRIAVRSRTLWP